jgi:RNA polymerase sigma-54 factor
MLKPSLQLKLGQSLAMTPQLQQAIRLLQLPVLDLNAQIQEALEENIMLEMPVTRWRLEWRRPPD